MLPSFQLPRIPQGPLPVRSQSEPVWSTVGCGDADAGGPRGQRQELKGLLRPRLQNSHKLTLARFHCHMASRVQGAGEMGSTPGWETQHSYIAKGSILEWEEFMAMKPFTTGSSLPLPLL